MKTAAIQFLTCCTIEFISKDCSEIQSCVQFVEKKIARGSHIFLQCNEKKIARIEFVKENCKNCQRKLQEAGIEFAKVYTLSYEGQLKPKDEENKTFLGETSLNNP